MNLEVQRLLDLVAQVPWSRRAEVLETCPDPLVRAEVESLLAYATGAEAYFEEAVRSVASSLRSSHDLLPGDLIGTYRVMSPLGRGGMGSVYLAARADGEIHQLVAVKVLHNDGRNPAWRDRFLRERQLLASLHHPSIVHVIDAGHTGDGRPFLVMEYVEGIPIDAYASTIDVRSRLKLFLRVCEGVSHAHQRLIIHRDLKPANILVDAAGQPKVLDFGIAKLVDETADATQTGERLLTPNYASPEQVSGGVQTTATDVYSLGAVLYKLLVGVAPRENTQGLLNAEGPPPSRINPDVPRDVDFIVRKAMRAEPAERYVSVDEFANDIRATLEWRPVQARSGDTWYRTRRFLRRYWVIVAATALVIASLSTGLYLANRQRVIAERRFGQLRQLSNKVIDLDRVIRTLPGSVEARQRLVAASLEYLEGLSQEARENLDLAQEVGEGYWRMGRIQGVNAEFNLGDTAKGETSMKKADLLIDSVLESRPEDRNALVRSAVIAHDRMILADTEGRRAESLLHARRAEERLDTLLRRDDPKNPARLDGFLRGGDAREAERSGAGLLFSNIALTYVNLHMYADGARCARRSIELARSIPSARDVASSGLSVLANALRYQGDLEGALSAIREAKKLAETATYPTETARLFNQYGPIFREGLILGEENAVNLNRPAEAAEVLQKGLDMNEAVARRDPIDSASRVRVAGAARELGKILHDRDPRRALAVYDLGIRRLSEIRHSPKARHERAVMLADSSYPLRRLHRASEAKDRIDSAFGILRDANEYPADSVRLGSPAYLALSALADYQAEAGDPREAIQTYEQLLAKVMAGNPDALGDLRDTPKLSRIYEMLAALYQRSGDQERAAAIRSRRAELWRAWENKLPHNAYVLRQVELARLP